MLRYLYFRLRFNQWFKSENGVKGFADQCMNWLLRRVMPLAKTLRIENQKLKKNNSEYAVELQKRENSAVIPDEEYPAIKTKVRSYTIAKWFFVVGELFFNFFAAKAIISAEGWVAVTGQLVIAIIFTYCFILLFEEIFEEMLNFKHYKANEAPNRNLLKLIVLSLIGIIYLLMVYYLCKVRGIQIEGGTGGGIISTLMMLLGMLSPVLAGYYDYQKSLIIGAYRNTNVIGRLTSLIAKNKTDIAVNIQKLKDRFKTQCEDKFAILQEFKIFKGNYNKKKSIKNESLDGHFSQNYDSFVKEAKNRYDEAVETYSVKPVEPVPHHKTEQSGKVLSLNSKVSTGKAKRLKQ